jgi:integrase
MTDEIKVTVLECRDRKHYQMRFRDPMTGRNLRRSTEILITGLKRDRTAAERVAAKWESELRDGRYHDVGKITWADFRERYETEVLGSLAETTDRKVSGVFNTIEAIVSPSKLRDLNAARLSYYQSKLRERGASENTIKGHLAHLGAALNWAKRMGMLSVVPTIEQPRRAKDAKTMKGRPINLEEFERLLAKIPAVVGDVAAVSWTHYLKGLWTSGLRLAESLHLCWDRDDKLCVDLSGKRLMLRIPAALEKGNKDRLLPIAPEFAEFLLRTPADQRTGYVFNPGTRRHSTRLSEVTVCRTVSAIGERAGVKVNTDAKSGKVKFASAHDLRRSFGERWASRIMPQVLMELMRHESIETTMKFYVGRNAQTTADVLWAAHEEQNSTRGHKVGHKAGKAESASEAPEGAKVNC